MALSYRQTLHALSETPFVDTMELAGILSEPLATIHRSLTGLLADGMVGRVSHGTAHLPSSRRYYLTARGIDEAAGILGFRTPSTPHRRLCRRRKVLCPAAPLTHCVEVL